MGIAQLRLYLIRSLCCFCFREKEALMGYLKSVERVLEQSKDQVRLSKGALGPYEHVLSSPAYSSDRTVGNGWVKPGPRVNVLPGP